jgi:hypothetical protein
MKKMFIVAFIVAAAIGACGGKKKSDATTPTSGSDTMGSDSMGSGSDSGSAATPEADPAAGSGS